MPNSISNISLEAAAEPQWSYLASDSKMVKARSKPFYLLQFRRNGHVSPRLKLRAGQSEQLWLMHYSQLPLSSTNPATQLKSNQQPTRRVIAQSCETSSNSLMNN